MHVKIAVRNEQMRSSCFMCAQFDECVLRLFLSFQAMLRTDTPVFLVLPERQALVSTTSFTPIPDTLYVQDAAIPWYD